MWWTDVNIKAESPQKEKGAGGGVREATQSGLRSLKVNFLPCSYRLLGSSVLMAATNNHKIRFGTARPGRVSVAPTRMLTVCYCIVYCLFDPH